MKRYRSLAMATVLSVAAVGALFAGSGTQTAKPAHKATALVAQYECTHCNIQGTANPAKAHNHKCDCGARLTLVKKPPGPRKPDLGLTDMQGRVSPQLAWRRVSLRASGFPAAWEPGGSVRERIALGLLGQALKGQG